MARELWGKPGEPCSNLNLNFSDIPFSETHLWEQFDDERKRLVIQTLARLLVKATEDRQQEQTND